VERGPSPTPSLDELVDDRITPGPGEQADGLDGEA
jgi:hypothetical protein